MSDSTAAEYARFRERSGVADLSSRAKLRLTGADRVRFLNGQVTANVKALAPGQALPACVTTAKGKLCGDVFIAAGITPDALFLDAEPELGEPLLARLERYIIADEVTLEEVTAAFALLHYFREPPESLRTRALRANRFGLPGWDLWLSPAERDAIFAEDPALSAELLETIRLENGVPRWGAELGPDTLPPEAGLDRTHIDYHKGCYVGQETISRLRSIGHVNRELAGFTSPTGAPLAPGMSVLPADAGPDEKPLGHLTSAGWSFALAKPIALGYLRRGSPTERLVARAAGNSAGPAIELALRDLPTIPSP
jgi:folate-binding protein YgfZ